MSHVAVADERENENLSLKMILADPNALGQEPAMMCSDTVHPATDCKP